MTTLRRPFHSYLVARISPGGTEHLDEPVDEGPVTPVSPMDFKPSAALATRSVPNEEEIDMEKTKTDNAVDSEPDRAAMRAAWEKDRDYAISTSEAWAALGDFLTDQVETVHERTRSVHGLEPEGWSYGWTFPCGGIDTEAIRDEMWALVASSYAMSGAYRRTAQRIATALERDAQMPVATVASAEDVQVG